VSINLVCDDCGKTVENATQGLPEGWTGDSFGTVRPVTARLTHRCDECHQALEEARTRVLDLRHGLRQLRISNQAEADA